MSKGSHHKTIVQQARDITSQVRSHVLMAPNRSISGISLASRVYKLVDGKEREASRDFWYGWLVRMAFLMPGLPMLSPSWKAWSNSSYY